MKSIKDDYYKIIDDYVSSRISAEVFKKIYTETYLNDEREYGDALFDILDRVFAEADLYTNDKYLLDKFDFYLNEKQLFEGAKNALSQLHALK